MSTSEHAGKIRRRHFVQGAAALGAGAALTLPPGPAAAAVSAGLGGPPVLRGNRFDLRLDRIAINKSGTPTWANAINGIVPGPVLHWQQGDVVTLNVTNNLPELTGVHWHGIILPNPMDGVPGMEFPGIQPGETFTYRFPVLQSGTYWYHSHMGYQEQKGVYGALVIEPDGEPLIKADRDYTVVLSDWMDGSPLLAQNNLKHMSDYYNFNRRTIGTFISDVQQSGFGATVKERTMLAERRLDPSGVNQPTGALFTYLMNGLPASANWTGLFRPSERVRLRFINTSAQTYYDVSIPGLTMSVVHVHGNDVVPVPVDQFRIGVAETYDVIVQPREDRAYTIFAQSLSRSGYVRGTLAPRPGMQAPIPPMDVAPMRTVTDIGTPHMMPEQIGASNADRTRIDGIKGTLFGKPTPTEKARRAGEQPTVALPAETKALKAGVESQYILKWRQSGSIALATAWITSPAVAAS